MTAPVTVSASARGYGALMATLIGTRTAQATTFNDRVRKAIQAQQDVKTSSKAGV